MLRDKFKRLSFFGLRIISCTSIERYTIGKNDLYPYIIQMGLRKAEGF